MQLNEESSWGKRGRSRSRSRGGGEEGARGEKQEQEEEGTQLEVSTGILTYSKVDKNYTISTGMSQYLKYPQVDKKV